MRWLILLLFTQLVYASSGSVDLSPNGLPSQQGNSGKVLTTDGQVASWGAAGGSGTVTSVGTGTGLTGGPITSTGTISLANTAVTAGSYTSANITVDAQGRLTSASNGSAGADVHLSNISATTIPVALLPNTVGTLDLGSSAKPWHSIYLGQSILDGSGLTAMNVLARSLSNSSGSQVFLFGSGDLEVAGGVNMVFDGGHGTKFNGSTSGTFTQTAADTTTSYSVKWPAAQGAASTFLQNDGSGNLTWAAAGSSGANVSLSNLSSVAVNTDLLPNSVATHDLGGSSFPWRNGYIAGTIFDGAGNASLAVGARNQINNIGTAISVWTGPDFALINGASLIVTGGKSVHLQGSSSGDFGQTAAASTTTYGVIWPPAQGAASTFLQNDGAGNLSWVASSAVPAGSTGAVQFNNAGSFGADSSNFLWDNTNKQLKLNSATLTQPALILNGANNSWGATIKGSGAGSGAVIEMDATANSSGGRDYLFFSSGSSNGDIGGGKWAVKDAAHALGIGAYSLIVDGANSRVGIGGVIPSSALEVIGHVTLAGAAPAVSACGTSPTNVGNDSAGRITVGTGVITSCTITFVNAFVNPPICTVSDESLGVAVSPTTITTTALTISSASSLVGTNLDYHCFDYQ